MQNLTICEVIWIAEWLTASEWKKLLHFFATQQHRKVLRCYLPRGSIDPTLAISFSASSHDHLLQAPRNQLPITARVFELYDRVEFSLEPPFFFIFWFKSPADMEQTSIPSDSNNTSGNSLNDTNTNTNSNNDTSTFEHFLDVVIERALEELDRSPPNENSAPYKMDPERNDLSLLTGALGYQVCSIWPYICMNRIIWFQVDWME